MNTPIWCYQVPDGWRTDNAIWITRAAWRLIMMYHASFAWLILAGDNQYIVFCHTHKGRCKKRLGHLIGLPEALQLSTYCIDRLINWLISIYDWPWCSTAPALCLGKSLLNLCSILLISRKCTFLKRWFLVKYFISLFLCWKYIYTRNSGRYAPFFLAPAEGWGALWAP